MRDSQRQGGGGFAGSEEEGGPGYLSTGVWKVEQEQENKEWEEVSMGHLFRNFD